MFKKLKNNKISESSNEWNHDDNNLISHQEWNWKLEQSIRHLRARINAVENRLSRSTSGTTELEPIDPDHSFYEFVKPEEDVHEISSMIEQYEKTLKNLKQSYEQLQQKIDLVEQKQKSSSIIMHVKGKEFPLEITGIIGGGITLLIALIVGFGSSDIVISPGFLSIIGLVLIGGTFFRSFGGFSMIRSFLSKNTKQTD